MKSTNALLLIVIGVILFAAVEAFGGPLDETRYCGPPKRDAEGAILRSYLVLKEFQALHPCPSTGLPTGACPGWSKNHIIPLACGGCDAVSNLQWLPVDVKACAGPHCIDRFERKIYAYGVPGTDSCKTEIVK